MALFPETKIESANRNIVPGTPKREEPNDKLLVIDCDTMVYAAASVFEYGEEVLAEGFYTDPADYKALVNSPSYDLDSNSVWKLNEEEAYQAVLR